MSNKLPDAFAKNRNEEIGEDNWSDFIVPHFIHDLGIKTQTKAHVIIGGRGCGKTTLLRYFCHPTQFSPRRPSVREDDLEHIGLYWRADTNFLNSFVGGGQTDAVWRSAFEHLIACELGKEIIRSLRSLNYNDERRAQFGGLDTLDLRALQDVDPSIGASLADVEVYLRRSRMRLAMWINNLDSQASPTFLPANTFLHLLIDELKSQLGYLKRSTFAVFIDEYENLREEQQAFINGLLKHGSAPLIFNIAMKRNGLMTGRTIGPESIQDISDYRTIDLETQLEGNFELFAAELMFLRLLEARPDLEPLLPIKVAQLRSVEQSDMQARFDDPAYKQRLLSSATAMLPRVSEQEAAGQILSDPKLRFVLINRLKTALQQRDSEHAPTEFVDERYAAASVIMSALISREREDIDKLATEYSALLAGEEGRLSSNEDLIANNLFGCVNAVYLHAQRTSILFSGFTALTLIARNNARHFLELVHRIFKAYDQGGTRTNELPVVPPEVQADAVREASELILNQVKGQGTYGPQLYVFAQCLGAIFRERHRNERQSEPEINHFTIQTGDLDVRLRKYLDEAEKWSVVFLSRETKMKSTGAASSDYVLNPVFAPHFQISFRKKRSLQMGAAQLLKMLEGDQATRDQLVRDLGKRASDSKGPDLFEGLST